MDYAEKVSELQDILSGDFRTMDYDVVQEGMVQLRLGILKEWDVLPERDNLLSRVEQLAQVYDSRMQQKRTYDYQEIRPTARKAFDDLLARSEKESDCPH